MRTSRSLKRKLITLALGLLGLGLSGLPVPAQEPVPPLKAHDLSAQLAPQAAPAQVPEGENAPLAASSFVPPIPEVSTTPSPVEFLFFFRHLASLEIAANGAIATGNAAAASWKDQDLRAAGLTPAEGAIVLEVAAGCNGVLGDYAAEIQAQAEIPAGEPPLPAEPSIGRTEIAQAAIDELATRLEEASFQNLVDYVHATFGSDIDRVTPVSEPPAFAVPGPGGPVVEPDAGGPEIFVISHIAKLSGQQVLSSCDTAIMDDLTARSYPGTDTICTLYGPGPWFDVPCGPSNIAQCTGIFPAFPGASYQTQGGHNLGLNVGTCGGIPGKLLDPLHYCGPRGSTVPVFPISGSLHPLGDFLCWDQNGYSACGLAQTVGRTVTLVEAYPAVVTLFPNGEQRFTNNINAYLQLFGPGTLSGNLYRAPATITTPQTAQIRACDANPAFPDDCFFATINLRPPFTVEVEPANREVLPGAELTYTAKIVPPSSTTDAEWSVSTTGTEPAGSFPSHSGLAGVYKAPANADIDVEQENTIKACVKPDIWGPTVCGITQVTVPSLLIYIDPEKTTLEPNETIRLTAYVFGTNEPQKVVWTPSKGFISTTSQDDTLHATYTAGSASPEGADITVCLQASPTACNTPQRPLHLNIVDPLAITSVSAQYNAGQSAPFTILGHGFGSNPQVSFDYGSVLVNLRTDTRIEGQLILPVAAGGMTTRASVRVTYFNGDFRQVWSTPPQPIAPATLRIDPPSAEVRAGESKPFQALCFLPNGILCSAPEIPTWPQPSLGTITQNGMYSAPATVAAVTSTFVTACWAGAPCAAAPVTLVPAASGLTVTVSPQTATVQAGGTKKFTVKVIGNEDKRVIWSLDPPVPAAGSIDQDGLYTAPATLGDVTTVKVVVESQVDPTKVDRATVTLTNPPPVTLTCSVSPSSAYYGTSIVVTAIATGGTPGTYQFAFFRRPAGVVPWIPDVTAPAWQPGNTYTWTSTASDAGAWELYVWVRDANTQPTQNSYGYAAGCNPGGAVLTVPPTLTSTLSPASASYGTTITWTATATGGIPGSVQFAFFRRKSGDVDWTPSVNAPAWQNSSVHSWTPTSADTGSWATYVWVRDANTPANMNTYGYAAGFNTGGMQVTTPPAPLTLTSTMSPASSPYGRTVSWTATATGGSPGSIQYAFFRRPSGAGAWIPSVNTPDWQSSPFHSWTPSAGDTGSWDTYVWVRDANTPANMNTYGFAAGFNTGGMLVTTPAPLTLTSTMSPASVNYGTAITWTATATGGIAETIQYAFFRRPSGASAWIPPVNNPSWQTGRSHSWTPSSSEVGAWATYVWVRDVNTPSTMNTYGYAAGFNTGGTQVTAPSAPLTLTSTMSPASSPYGRTITWTATATGGSPGSIQYAFFRRPTGAGDWIPSVNSPAWQSGNSHSWTPTASDVGSWETYVWVRDANTPASMNTYGYAAGFNTGGLQVTTPAPLTLTSTMSPASANYGTTITWTATATGGIPETLQYAFFRRPAGGAWFPSVNSPAWQSSNVYSWTPSSSDVGGWDTYVWVRDVNTPASMNTYGYAAGFNTGGMQVTTP